jgi:hypothetical protein
VSGFQFCLLGSCRFRFLLLCRARRPLPKEPGASRAIVTPEQLVWKPVVPGVELAVVSGDLDKEGDLCKPAQNMQVLPSGLPRSDVVLSS